MDDFAATVAPHRRELRALCYRMLGSVDDADDALQEVLVRAWRGIDGFEGRSSLRTWLFRIATNTCLNRLERRLGPYPDRFLADDHAGPEAAALRTESVELAFMAALQHLSARAGAVLILRTVLDYPARETADMLGISVAAVNSSLQRARATLRRDVQGPSQAATVRELGDAKVRDLVGRYARAMAAGDVDGVLDVLADDATWSMPPMPAWYQG